MVAPLYEDGELPWLSNETANLLLQDQRELYQMELHRLQLEVADLQEALAGTTRAEPPAAWYCTPSNAPMRDPRTREEDWWAGAAGW